jgi:hypothetical protein
MGKYECLTCGYICSQKSHYDKHMNRKNKCTKDIIKVYICEYCDYEFEKKNLLNRHINYNCKIKKDLECSNKTKTLEEEIELLKKIIHEQNINNSNNSTNTSNHNTTNSHNTNTNTNSNNTSNNVTNINNQYIVNFGKEDINKLSDDEKIAILESSYNCIIKCLEFVNLNPALPEQMNLYINDLKSKHSYKYQDVDFQATSTNTLLTDVLNNRINDVRDLIEQNDKLGVEDKYIERCGKRIDHFDNDNLIEINKVRNEAMYNIFNAKKIILANKNKK